MNIYDVYRPCFTAQEMTLSQKYQHFLRRRLRNLKFGEPIPPTETPPCVDGVGIDEFLGSKAVRAALNIPENVPDYAMCTDETKLKYESNPQGSYWVYKKLIPKKKYKIVIYSGDTDPAVPVTGSIDWINMIREELQLATVEYWRPWFVGYEAGKQNAGNVWRLRGLNFVTFRGVGHMAPQWNQAAGLKMINWMLHDTEL
jgi:cathepsin A (carboxypeptidase C)